MEKIASVLRRAGIAIPPQIAIRSRRDLERAWRSRMFGLAEQSEGLVLKALDWIYRPGPATDGSAKIKHVLEVKAIVLGFNPTLVRLRHLNRCPADRLELPFQSHAGSIEADIPSRCPPGEIRVSIPRWFD